MVYHPDIHHRRSIRLKGYDYGRSGAYFVTICTHGRECLFGGIAGGRMRLNEAGQVAWTCWDDIPGHFPHVRLDEFVVMPNHIHGIIFIADGRGTACRAHDADGGSDGGTACRAPTGERFGAPVVGSLPTVVRSFKSAVTKCINELRHGSGMPVWQRNYYEQVIRDENELSAIRAYIANNPTQWETDKNNPYM